MTRIVFWDLDYTLLRSNSANLFIRYLLERGELGWADVLKGLYYTTLYRINRIEVETVFAKHLLRYRGFPEATLITQCEEWFERFVVHDIYAEARVLIETHRQAGQRQVILTASTVYACQPIAQHLGVDDFVGTRLAIENGLFTGAFEPPLCFGTGKLQRAQEFLQRKGGGATLADCRFYTDSITDLPMLEAVGDPQVINPDPLLAREAKRRGWPIRRFHR